MDNSRSDSTDGNDSAGVERLVKAHAVALQRAFEEGARVFPSLPIPRETFVRRLIERILRRMERAGLEPTAEKVAKGLGRIVPADLYLAVACEERVSGAWELLTERYVPQLRALLVGRGVAEVEAEEIAARVPGDLIQPPGRDSAPSRLATYDGLGSLFSWMAAIALRRHADRTRSRKSERLEVSHESASLTLDPAEFAVDGETCSRLNKALSSVWPTLTRREQLALLYRYRLDLAQKEIARVLGVSEPRVSGLLKTSIVKIQEAVHGVFFDQGLEGIENRDLLWKKLGGILENHMKDPSPSSDHGADRASTT
jgi:RNA polymerase sigma-70 factor, ECF subfamily